MAQAQHISIITDDDGTLRLSLITEANSLAAEVTGEQLDKLAADIAAVRGE